MLRVESEPFARKASILDHWAIPPAQPLPCTSIIPCSYIKKTSIFVVPYSHTQKTSLEKSPTMTVTEHTFKMRILSSTTFPQLIDLCLTVVPLKPDPRLVQYLERATANMEPISAVSYSTVEMKRHSHPTLIFLNYSTGTIEY